VPRHIASSLGRSARLALGLAVLAGLGWAAWSGVLRDAPDEVAPGSPTAATDARQHELLRRNLDAPGDPELGARFQAINARHFNGDLPAIPVSWEPELATVGDLAGGSFSLQGMFGFIDGRSRILLTPELQADQRALDRVLCHEIVHAYLHTIGDTATHHGPAFQTVLRRLSAEGAFEGLVATDEERAQLRAWLDAEAARIDSDGRALEALDLRLRSDLADVERAIAELARGASPDEAARVTMLRDTYNERATDANARVGQLQRDRERFAREAERYNLMIAYPDGLDAEAFVVRRDGSSPAP
jgi:hypothetical protein